MAKSNVSKKESIGIVSTADIKALAQVNIDNLVSITEKAQSALSKMYADGKALAVKGIASGLGAHNAAYREQTRRVAMYAEFIFKSGASGAKTAQSIVDYIYKQLKADGYNRPTRELAADEKAEKQRTQDANRKAKERAVAKAKVELKKAEPARQWKDGELEELAAVKVADKKAETADRMKQRNAVQAIMEGKASINVLTFGEQCKAGKFSDGAMPRTLSAFVAFLSTFKEEAAE